MITRDNKPYIIKGPYMNDDDVDNIIKIQTKKEKLGLPIIKTQKLKLFPDMWPEGVPLGARNKVIRGKKYSFLMSESITPISNIILREHKSNLWPSTLVIDPEKTILHLNNINELKENQKITLLNLIAFRCKYKLSDLAKRNFLITDNEIYSIDEETINPDFSLYNELKKSRFNEIKELFGIYNNKMVKSLVKYLDEELK